MNIGFLLFYFVLIITILTNGCLVFLYQITSLFNGRINETVFCNCYIAFFVYCYLICNSFPNHGNDSEDTQVMSYES